MASDSTTAPEGGDDRIDGVTNHPLVSEVLDNRDCGKGIRVILKPGATFADVDVARFATHAAAVEALQGARPTEGRGDAGVPTPPAPVDLKDRLRAAGWRELVPVGWVRPSTPAEDARYGRGDGLCHALTAEEALKRDVNQLGPVRLVTLPLNVARDARQLVIDGRYDDDDAETERLRNEVIEALDAAQPAAPTPAGGDLRPGLQEAIRVLEADAEKCRARGLPRAVEWLTLGVNVLRARLAEQPAPARTGEAEQ